tara:strand:- start:40 stop:348 length:309 start_codon:yes stop_codon:yes gene_type:complete
MEYFIAILVVAVVGYVIYDRYANDTTSTMSTDTVVDTASEITPAPAPAPVADVNDNGIVSKAELNSLTKVQLLEMADRESLSVKRSGKKAEVVNEIWTQLRA